jgi:hypothetical protein
VRMLTFSPWEEASIVSGWPLISQYKGLGTGKENRKLAITGQHVHM